MNKIMVKTIVNGRAGERGELVFSTLLKSTCRECKDTECNLRSMSDAGSQ